MGGNLLLVATSTPEARNTRFSMLVLREPRQTGALQIAKVCARWAQRSTVDDMWHFQINNKWDNKA